MMPGNTFGQAFRVTTFGESHGVGVGCVIDGCPPGLEISAEKIQHELDRRRPGQSDITTPRDEADRVEILSGVVNGRSLGTPISLLIRNKNQHSADYKYLEKNQTFRPSHADFTYQSKYGLRAIAGGGRASARETIGRVAAGAIAKQFLQDEFSAEILAYVTQIHDIEAIIDESLVTVDQIEKNIVRCPDEKSAENMIARIRDMKKSGDSVGGVIQCVARNIPVGLGEPVFDKLEAELAHGMLSIPAVKGFEIGSGFAGTRMTGSEHNDSFINKSGTIGTATNNSGGIQGGISNGEPISFRVAFKPTATILQKQMTVDEAGNSAEIHNQGRHDPCVLPRAVPIVEAMTAITLMDHVLRYRGQVDKK